MIFKIIGFVRPLVKLILVFFAVFFFTCTFNAYSQQQQQQQNNARKAASDKHSLILAQPIRVLVWDEQQPEQKKLYPNFLGNHLAQHLSKNQGLQITSANIHQSKQGLSEEIINQTDVLIWWGNVRHDDVPQETARAIVDRVKEGRLSLIVLHSAHWALPFRTAMEDRVIQDAVKMLPVRERDEISTEFIQWRNTVMPSRSENPRFDSRIEQSDGSWQILLERPTCIFPDCCTPVQPSLMRVLLPDHPIAKGIPSKFTLPETEMYDEPFHVPEPDEVIFRESWVGGEYFRSGMVWKLGRGHIFYFRPGHETYRVFTEPEPLKIVENASLYFGAKIQSEAEIQELKGPQKKILVFSKTSWYRHPAIPMINDYLTRLGDVYNFEMNVTENSEIFNDTKLAEYDVVLLVSTTDIGKSLNAQQKRAFIKWYRNGNGVVALHAAGVHHDTWDWYSRLFGTDFNSDSEYVPARIDVDETAKNHWLLDEFPQNFTLDGDWLNFKNSVRGLEGVKVLLTLDESTYDPVRPQFKETGGKPMGKDHPMAWIRKFEGGRFAYTMIGHDTRPLETSFGEQHLIRMIRWAAGETD